MNTPQRPGWYPDPDGSSGERWFNGIGWSESKRTAGGKSFTAPLQPPPGKAARAWHSAKDFASPRAAPPASPGQPLNTQFAGARTIDLSQNRPATAALVLGAISLFFGLAAVPAIILGIIAIGKAKTLPPEKSGRGVALVGLLLAAIGIVLGAVPIVLFILGALGALSEFAG